MNDPSDREDYFNYLQRRSLAGKLYRNFLLYPRLNACLSGIVLDYGCGIGDFLRFRSATLGVDINAFNIEYCKSQGLKAEQLGETGSIPHGQKSFSGIVMDNVIEHIPPEDVDSVVDEVLRVLSPNGKLLIGVPGLKGFNSDSDHKHFYSEQGLIELLGRHGCKRVKSFHMPISIPWMGKYLSQYCIYVLFVQPSSTGDAM